MPPGRDTALVLAAPEDPQVTAARERLRRAQERTQDAMDALRTDLARRADWRVWYRAKPVYFIAGAFLLGFCLSRRR